jgi:hypothetical protein
MTTTYDAGIPYDSSINYDGGPSVITPAILPTFALKVKSKAGVISPLPEAQIESVSFEDSAASAISFSVAKSSVGASLVDDYSIVSMTNNGKDVLDGRWLLRGKGWNAGETGQIKAYTGKSLLWDRLERTTIQPSALGHKYLAKSPGFILDQLFAEAKVRNVGYWTNFTWDFTTSVDSNGMAWPQVLGSMEYLPTAKYSDIVANLVDKGLIEVHLLGDEIQVLVANSSGRQTNALLVVGKDLSDAPQQSSADNIISDVTVLGDDGVAVTRSNPLTSATYWREEGAVSQGGTKDVGTLSLFGDVALSGGDAPRVQRTYGLVITPERPNLPVRDYVVGDWVRVQHGDESRISVRVKQIVLKQDKNQMWSGTLILNDKFIENELRLVKKVEGIIGGATITGSAQTSTPDNLKDTGKPAPMTGLSVITSIYQNNEGITKGLATASWDLVTLNTDGTLATDMGTYIVVWWYTDQPFSTHTDLIVQHPENTVTWSNLDPGREINVYVFSKDTNGNQGSWGSGPISVAIGKDTIAPPTPSNPAGTSLLRTFVLQWNGLTSAGQPMPPDFKHVEIWSSENGAFDPNVEGYFWGTLANAGFFYVNGYAYPIGTDVYFKFIAVDRSGNRSAASSPNVVTLTGISAPDVNAGAITANAIGAGEIKAIHIGTGAIDTYKLSVGSTANIVPDPSFNNAEWRARRLSTDWADKPDRWFFTNWSGRSRNGYYLQALSQVDGNNGGRMYVTDWLPTMYGETYYFGTYFEDGETTPNAAATLFLGYEITKTTGEIISGGTGYNPTSSWSKVGYLLPIADLDWSRVRFFVRADDMNAGDIIMDDWEVRSGVGTTAVAGPRILLTPPRFEAYNSSEQRTVLIEAETGDVVIRGSLSSGFSGKRVEINPSVTFLPEIRFFPSAANIYAYINAVDNGPGTIPFIGVNAPDTGGASYAMVLFDSGFQLGEITKATGTMTGPGLESSGTGQTAYTWLRGKMPVAGAAQDMLSAGRFNVGGNTGVPSITIAMTKPPNPSSGQWTLLWTINRNGTSQKILSFMSGNTTTASNVQVHPSSDTAGTLLTTVNTYINYLFIRCDGDV